MKPEVIVECLNCFQSDIVQLYTSGTNVIRRTCECGCFDSIMIKFISGTEIPTITHWENYDISSGKLKTIV